MNVRIFWVRAMKCMCAQTRPQFILSSEGVFGGMEFEPMLTPREKSPVPENLPRGGSNPRRCGQRAQALPTELFRPRIPNVYQTLHLYASQPYNVLVTPIPSFQQWETEPVSVGASTALPRRIVFMNVWLTRWPSGYGVRLESVKPGFDSRFRCGCFSGSSHTSDLKIDAPVATLPDA